MTCASGRNPATSARTVARTAARVTGRVSTTGTARPATAATGPVGRSRRIAACAAGRRTAPAAAGAGGASPSAVNAARQAVGLVLEFYWAPFAALLLAAGAAAGRRAVRSRRGRRVSRQSARRRRVCRSRSRWTPRLDALAERLVQETESYLRERST